VKAPRNGVWYQDLAEEGEYLQTGQPLGLLRAIDQLDLEVEVAGFVRLALCRGQPVTVELLDAEPGLTELKRVREGCRIRLLPAGSSEVSRRFPVVVEVPNPERELTPGLFARARFILSRDRPLLLVPKESVFQYFGRPAAYIVAGDERAGYRAELRYLEVRELRKEPASWQVVGGLEAGSRVVLSPIEQLADGARITPEDGGDEGEAQ
jgi:multidrug efflux pump subunit AcrA (membrane-fusion protein)